MSAKTHEMSTHTLGSRPHAMVIPFPAQGHIGPMMHLSIKLAKEAGFVITFVNTHHHHTLLEKLLEPRFREQGLDDIHLAEVVNAGRDSGDTTGAQSIVELCEAFFKLTPAFESLVESLLPRPTGHREDYVSTTWHPSRKSSSLPPLTCIISDLFLYFTQDIAKKYGLKYVAFWTASAGMLATTMSVVAHGHRAPPPDHEHVQEPLITWIPGVPPLKRSEINEFLLNPDPEDLMYDIYHTSYKRLREATCIVINTLEELEAEPLAALRKDNEPVEICSVGPLLPDPYFKTGDRGGQYIAELKAYPMAALWKEDDKCVEWLNRQDPGSVLYVSFGSITIMSGEQFEELAMGLEGSGSPVLWVIRPDLMAGSGGRANFPDGFLERTKDRVFIVEWAPQLQVLAHPSVGGFLTHCGWNSTLESISAGVPTLGWPYFADQMLNNRCLMDKWGLGLEFKRGDHVIVRRDEVARKVRTLMIRNDGEDPPAQHKASAIGWQDSGGRPSGSSYPQWVFQCRLCSSYQVNYWLDTYWPLLSLLYLFI